MAPSNVIEVCLPGTESKREWDSSAEVRKTRTEVISYLLDVNKMGAESFQEEASFLRKFII
jgi:hypothetical protein